MKKTKHNRSRQAARPCKREANLRERLEKKLLKVCADIGCICGWQKERPLQLPQDRPSSRRRVTLGRLLAAQRNVLERSEFGPVEAGTISNDQTSCRQVDLAEDSSCLINFALDVQEELARLRRMGIRVDEVIQAFVGARVQPRGCTPWERQRLHI